MTVGQKGQSDQVMSPTSESGENKKIIPKEAAGAASRTEPPRGGLQKLKDPTAAHETLEL